MRIGDEFFHRDVLEVAPDLVGKLLCREADGHVQRLRITETEAYRGEEDTACHACHGRTPRAETLYAQAGTLYVYLCYGMHNLLNIVTGEVDQPQAVLIRACDNANGPGKLTKRLHIDRSYNKRLLSECGDVWIEYDGLCCRLSTAPRVGIGYASEEDQAKLWRFIAGSTL